MEIKRPKYFIAIKKNEGDVLHTLKQYIPMLPPKNRFYADPMLFKHQGINYLFFEDYDYKKGVIAYVTIDPNGHTSKPHCILELSTHLSFPYVFQDEKEIYMTPETYNQNSISLFKSLDFPRNWVWKRTLVKGRRFSDPILFKHYDYYWLFTSVAVDHLHIYYANSLDAEFLPHPINRKSIRGRNAGGVYYMDGKLIRPTMDCRKHYGRSMILKEIVLLDPVHFIEKELAVIEPNWEEQLTGTHTYCQNEDFVVYDGQRMITPADDTHFSSELK